MARRRYQKGRLFLRGKREKKWIGRWREDVIEADGKTRRVERSAVLGILKELPTERLARRRLDAILSPINAPDYRPGKIATVREFAERWKSEVLVYMKPSTKHAAKSHIAHHILPTLGNMKLDQIGKELQQQFAGYLCRSVSPKMALNVLGTLSAMTRTAKSWGYVAEPVAIGELVLPVQLPAEPRCLTSEQAVKIILAAEHPYRAMFAIAAMTGMRAGEIMALETRDIDLGRRLVSVRRSSFRGRIQTPKSKASVAVLPIPEPLAVILGEYLEGREPGLLFQNRHGKPLDQEKVVRYHLRPILDELKIPYCGFHAFRHLHASLLLEVGASPKVAQAQLRHADARITVGIYGHVVGDSQRQAVERLAEVLRPDAPKLEGTAQVIQ